MNKRRNLFFIFASLSLLVITMALSTLPFGSVSSSYAREYGSTGIFSSLVETSLLKSLDAYLPLVMYSLPSPTPTPTATATLTPTPTVTPTPTQPSVDTYTQCRNAGLNILDNGFAVDGMTVSKSGKIQSMRVYLDVAHTFVNDLVFTLEQESTSKKLTLIRNPVTSGGGVCSGDNIDVWLSDTYSTPVNNSCLTSLIPTISGYRRPYMLLVPYNGEQMAGNWQMVASDTRAGDSGRLNVWCLEFTYSQ